MTRSASLGSNLARNPCIPASAPAKKEQIELEVGFTTKLLLQFVVCVCVCVCVSQLAPVTGHAAFALFA